MTGRCWPGRPQRSDPARHRSYVWTGGWSGPPPPAGARRWSGRVARPFFCFHVHLGGPPCLISTFFLRPTDPGARSRLACLLLRGVGATLCARSGPTSLGAAQPCGICQRQKTFLFSGGLVPPGGCLVSSVRSLCFSAFRSGSLAGLLLRPSRRAASGRVLVCSFRSAAGASRFARLWAGRLGVSVAVRCSAGLWSVSVPVSWPSSSWPGCVGRVVWVRGGLRGFLAALGWSGLGVLRVAG